MATNLLSKYGTYEEENLGKLMGVIAHSGGGQTSALQIYLKWTEIGTCAAHFDSLKLLPGNYGLEQTIFNNTLKIASVYPQLDERINGIQNLKFNIPAGQIVTFKCAKTGYWYPIGQSNTTYKVWRALLTQSGTAAPTIVSDGIGANTPFSNSIGDIVLTRFSAGIYTGTLSGAFPVDKTSFLNFSLASPLGISFGRTSDNTFSITTVSSGVATDGLFSNAGFEIIVKYS